MDVIKKLFLFGLIVVSVLACHKKKKPFLLLPLVDNSAVTDNSGGGSGGGSGDFNDAKGTFDNTFNGTGFIIEEIDGNTNNYDIAYAVIIQSDGKILVGGSCGYASCLARFNPDGSLDNSFGTNGKTINDFTAGYDIIYNMKIAPDGNILAGGTCNIQFCIAKFDINNGSLIFLSTENLDSFIDFGKTILTQSTGEILLGGYCDNKFCIARFNSNCTLDTTFNNPAGTNPIPGYNIIDVGSGNDFSHQGSTTILPSNGKILMGGHCQNPNTNFCLVQLDQDGTLDNSFNGTGKAFFDLTSDQEYAYSLLREPSGKILLGGNCYKDIGDGSGTNNHFCVARIDISNPTPSLDSSFNSTGESFLNITSGPNTEDQIFSLAIQPNGKILSGGSCDTDVTPSKNYQFCLARFNSDGTLDTTFGSPNGHILLDLSTGNDESYSIALQPDGKIVMVGSCNKKFCIARIQ